MHPAIVAILAILSAVFAFLGLCQGLALGQMPLLDWDGDPLPLYISGYLGAAIPVIFGGISYACIRRALQNPASAK